MMATTEVASQIFQQLRNGTGAEETATYVAVPAGEAARWLLPAATPEIGGMLASWAPYRLRSRLAWTAVRAANRLGRVAELQGVSVLEVEGTGSADWAELGWRGGEPPIPVIYLGTPGWRRKAVVHLVERGSGRCRGVVKVPLTDAARVAILHEAEVLDSLAKEGFEYAPRLLHADWRRAITTQTYVEGGPASRRMTPEVWGLLHLLLLPGETTTLAEQAHTWAREINETTNGLAESRIVRAAIGELLDDSPLPACWQHGDFTPWNIKRLRHGGCALLDWEDGHRKGLPLQDAYHFLHMQDWLFGREPRLHAREIWEEALAMGVPPGAVPELENAYLAGSYMKCVRERNPERARFVIRALGLRRRNAA